MTAGGRGRQSKKTDALIEGAAPALLVLTLFLARFQLMRQAGLGLSQAWHLGLVYGLIQDTALCLLAWALASALGHLPGLRFRVVWIPLSVFIWLATTANVFYHEYFGSRLEAWVLRYHLHDLTDISGSAGAMGFSPWPA
ncbi:MAG TPA: hypothetical protein VL588_03415, partial [Bdellovibrionota bacterium]|nr:hypothetical protein [Bdellovibrionota bacterium]